MEVAVITPTSTYAWRPARGGPATTRVAVGDLSRVGEARRAADAIARSCGLDEHARGLLGIVVTEASTNLARHARDGVVLLRSVPLVEGEPTSEGGVEMLAVDRGPGMQDLSTFFTDGFSTGGSSGTGLGAIRRQSDQLDVYSRLGQGTIVMARVFATGAERPEAAVVESGVVCVPLEGETACGDGWSIHQEDGRAVALLVDGLGHGPNAADASEVATTAFRSAVGRPPREIVSMIHEALRSTRGAALGIAEIVRTGDGATVTYCGVGNTVASIVGPSRTCALASMNGTAGLSIPAVREFTQQWAPGDLLVMHTDGIAARWRLDSYPGIATHQPAITAAALHRDFARSRDDATVLALALAPRKA